MKLERDCLSIKYIGKLDPRYGNVILLTRTHLFFTFTNSSYGGSPQLYYHDCSERIPGHTTRAPPVGFALETNGFQFYAVANLDKTSLIVIPHFVC